ncbi:MAG: hypothetical protein AAF456_01195 [Planctomycetota bacterium]
MEGDIQIVSDSQFSGRFLEKSGSMTVVSGEPDLPQKTVINQAIFNDFHVLRFYQIGRFFTTSDERFREAQTREKQGVFDRQMYTRKSLFKDDQNPGFLPGLNMQRPFVVTQSHLTYTRTEGPTDCPRFDALN